MRYVSHESRTKEVMSSQTYVYSAGSYVCQVMSKDENISMNATTRAMLMPQALVQTQRRGPLQRAKRGTVCSHQAGTKDGDDLQPLSQRQTHLPHLTQGHDEDGNVGEDADDGTDRAENAGVDAFSRQSRGPELPDRSTRKDGQEERRDAEGGQGNEERPDRVLDEA